MDSVVTSDRLLFVALAIGLAIPIAIYSHFYFKGSANRSRFFILFGLFIGSVLITLLADHALMLVTGWELCSLIGFFLISLKASSVSALRAARLSLMTTLLGGLGLLLAVIILAEGRGSYSLSILTTPWEGFLTLPLRLVVVAGLVLAILTKSAQLPFSFWLPQAMAAPTPVSAYLHSASLVSLGVFLTVLFAPLMQHILPWHIALSTLGLLTFAFGASIALFQADLKRALASTTLSQLGLMITLAALARKETLAAALLLLAAHAIYKSSLFLWVGGITKATNSLDLRHLEGAGRESRLLAWTLVISLLSLFGIFPTLSFFAKESALSVFVGPFASEGVKYFSWTCVGVGLLSLQTFGFRLLFVLFAAPLAARPDSFRFLQNQKPLFLISLLIAGAGVVWGCVAALTHDVHLHLLLLSLAFLAGAALLAGYLTRHALYWPGEHSLGYWVDRAIEKIQSPSRSLETETELNRFGLFLFVTAALLLLFLPELNSLPVVLGSTLRDQIFSLSIFAAGALSILLPLLHSGLPRIFLLGAIGICVSLAYATFGAPDLLLTQILVEAASLILLVLAWNSFREPSKADDNPWKWILSVLLAAGLLFPFLANSHLAPIKRASLFFFENAEAAFGSNLVNLIIVDFRAFDTLAETTVFALAWFCIRAWLKEGARPQFELSEWARTVVRPSAVGLALISLWILMRGHHAPGGGFIGGLLLALSFVLLHFASGPLRRIPDFFTTAGLLLAYVSSLLPHSFSLGIGSIFSLGSSALIFDTGVYLTVAGSLSGILIRLFSQLIPTKETPRA